MYQRAIIAGGFLVCCILVSCTRQGKQHQADVSASASRKLEIAENEKSKSPHPLSIEALRKRDFPELEIELQNRITADEGLEAWEFTYNSDGYTIYSLLEKPVGETPPGGWPVIIVAHGYIPPDAFLTWRNYRSITKYFAKGGFLVLKPDYRGHGRSEGISNGPISAIDYSIDVLNLIEQIDSIEYANTDNVFLFGHSMGGDIGLRILTISEALRGATLWAPASKGFPENKLFFIRTERPEEVRAQELEDFQNSIDALFTPDEYDSLNPEDYFDLIDVPVLVHHGTADHIIPLEWSTSLIEAFDKKQVDYTFYEYPGEDHNISVSYYKVMDRDMEFFRDLIE